jgi:hypothetical protein
LSVRQRDVAGLPADFVKDHWLMDCRRGSEARINGPRHEATGLELAGK